MKDVLSVGVPESGGADTGMGKTAASQDSVLGLRHVFVGGARIHASAWWADSHWDVFKVASYKISLL